MTFPQGITIDTTEDLSCFLGQPVELLLADVDFDGLRDEVIVSGSIIDGFGNSFSDVDLLLITPKNSCSKPSVHFWPAGQRWVDVEVFDEESLGSIIASVHRNNGRPPVDWGQYIAPRYRELDVYHRFTIGLPLTTNAQRCLDKLQFNTEVLSLEVTYHRLLDARARWQDAVGAFKSQQYGQAAHAGNIARLAAVEAYAALLGQTNPSPKWIWAKLHRIEGDCLGVKEWEFALSEPLKHHDSVKAEQIIIQTAELIFQVMHKALCGFFVNYEHDVGVLSRYEIIGDQVVLINEDNSLSATSKCFEPLALDAA